jgi:signal transduction histidine kinase
MTGHDESGQRLLTLAVHELRTPLNVAAGYLKMLADPRSGPLSERQAQLAARAGESLERLAALVAHLGEVARMDAGELPVTRRRHDLGALAAAVVEALPREGPAPRVVLDAEPGSHPADIDVERMARTLRACVDALVRETQEPGLVVVSVARRDTTTATITVARSALPPNLGPGTGWGPVDEWRGGLGLEIPLARRVIEHHGGQLLSPTAPDHRPAFMLVLPLAGKNAPSTQPDPSA